MRWLQDRPRTGRSGIVGLVLLAVLWAIFCLPLHRCPCEGRLRTIPLSTPTDDRYEFTAAGCRICEGSGRIPPYEHWRVSLASR